jgi:hypothetical protein
MFAISVEKADSFILLALLIGTTKAGWVLFLDAKCSWVGGWPDDEIPGAQWVSLLPAINL